MRKIDWQDVRAGDQVQVRFGDSIVDEGTVHTVVRDNLSPRLFLWGRNSPPTVQYFKNPGNEIWR